MLSYYGRQRVIPNNAGQQVYGGSHLVCVRGGWDALDRLPIPVASRIAVAQARCYDAAMAHYPGFLVSRRNYDVGQGVDEGGKWQSGVLESSWRVGGASTAELAAFTAMASDPELRIVEAASVKQFGRSCECPPDATVHFRGDDPDDGPITRYSQVTKKLRWPPETTGACTSNDAR
jgi:hypothetical protein